MTTKKKIQVLLVDDEDRFRETATATLEKRGFSVTAVAGGAEAIAKARKGEFDVVVLDVKMPGMDGNEALQQLKIIKPALAVIMLTGHGTMQSAMESYRNDVYAYLTKPCDIEILAEKIRDAVAKKTGLDSALWHSISSGEGPMDGGSAMR